LQIALTVIEGSSFCGHVHGTIAEEKYVQSPLPRRSRRLLAREPGGGAEAKDQWGGGMKRYKLWGAIALLVLIVVVILQNTEAVETRFLFMTVTMPRAALLAITLLIGVAAGMLLLLALSGRSIRKITEP
jgi:lipopolysaccharide assembly protein A